MMRLSRLADYAVVVMTHVAQNRYKVHTAAKVAAATRLPAPTVAEVRALMDEHLRAHYAFYGEFMGVRTARKHIGWYVRDLVGGEAFRQEMNRLEVCEQQLAAVDAFFELQLSYGERLQYGLAEQKLAA